MVRAAVTLARLRRPDMDMIGDVFEFLRAFEKKGIPEKRGNPVGLRLKRDQVGSFVSEITSVPIQWSASGG